MRRTLRSVAFLALLALLVISAFVAFWLGLVPQRFAPFGPLDLDERPGWLTGAKLSILRRDPALCRAVLEAPAITATPVSDNTVKPGCGWRNAVKVSALGDARLAAGPLTCEMAAAMALWVRYEVQPAAEEILGSKVRAIEDFGTFSCRTIIGNAQMRRVMSEHASANALDVSGFTLADGRTISVARHWKGDGPESRFLREVHSRACGIFRVALSPEYNVEHRDHFHLDRGVWLRCK